MFQNRIWPEPVSNGRISMRSPLSNAKTTFARVKTLKNHFDSHIHWFLFNNTIIEDSAIFNEALLITLY